MIRRFYFEVAGARPTIGRAVDGSDPAPLSLLADPRLAPALAALRGAAGDDQVRVAAVVPLSEGVESGAEVDAVLRAADALRRHELHLDVWPQLDPHFFLNAATARAFQERLLPLVDALEREARASGIGLALDVEPRRAHADAAWGVVNGSVPGRVGSAVRFAFESVRSAVGARQGARDLHELARDLKARTLPIHAAVLPPLLLDGEKLRARFLGCHSVDDDGEPLFSTQAAMCYATSLSRLSRRYDRDRQKQTLALWGARHKLRFDAVVVGQTCTGIFGDEPTYDDPRMLAEDVRAMEALGFTDIGVYALEGVLFGKSGMPDGQLRLRDDVEAWIGAAFGR